MGFRFRKRVKIAPGIVANFGKNGLSSWSFGKPGATINVRNDGGVSGTAGIPGTGISYKQELRKAKKTRRTSDSESAFSVDGTSDYIYCLSSNLTAINCYASIIF